MAVTETSVGRAQHSVPTFTLYGRIAATYAGRLTLGAPSLHFSLVIYDAYAGSTVIDGQPTFGAGYKNMLLIQSNVYHHAVPDGVKVMVPIGPPSGVSADDFARKLRIAAQNFASYTAPYMAPQSVVGNRMRPGEYNSSSFLAGLLQAVTGSVPPLSLPGYSTPGWETPMSEHYFKGEAIR